MNDNSRNSGFYNLSRITSTDSSSRISITSSRYASGLTANSTFSSLEDLHSITTSNSSAIDFLDESIESNLDIIDDLDFDDESVMGTEYIYFVLF